MQRATCVQFGFFLTKQVSSFQQFGYAYEIVPTLVNVYICYLLIQYDCYIILID